MIVVTGATGQLGGAVVRDLLRRIPASQIVTTVRDAGKASELAARGVSVRIADFSDADSLERAFAGADQLLIVSVDKLGDEARQLHRAAIKAARSSGVGRILYTSHVGARHGSPFLPADQHADTEADLAASGSAYTALRHGFYAESCLWMVGNGLCSGTLRVPEDGPVSWTTRADLAEADAAVLAGEGRLDGLTPPLAARDAITMAELASIASDVTGRDIRHVVVPDEEWRDEKVAAGMPSFHAEMLLGTFRAARSGDFAATGPALEQLLGRAPRTMREVLATSLSRPGAQP